MLTEPPACPICRTKLDKACEHYHIDEIFDLWAPITFSQPTKAEHRAIAEKTDLYRCPQCSLELFLPAIVGTPSFYVEAYNLEYTQGDSKFGYSDDKWDFEEALRDIKECKSVLEFGSGNGIFLKKISNLVSNVVGLEYNDAAIDQAQSIGVRVYSIKQHENLPMESWDAVLSFHVLEHVENPVQFLETMAAKAKKGGIIAVSVPNQDGPIKYIKPCVMNLPPHHATRWKLATFEALADKMGLEIVRVAYEPLLLENHSYYSVYWPRIAVPGSSWLLTRIRMAISLSLRGFFGGLRRIGFIHFPFLRGLSIYVVMRKSN